MKNVVILLCVLLLPYLALILANRFAGRLVIAPSAAGRLSLALLLLVTGAAHFVQTEPMTRLLPETIPSRTLLIYLSGVVEIIAALALLLPRTQRAAGWFLVVWFILVFPANVYAALNHVPFGGHEMGPVYLAMRGPLQLLLIWWAWYFAARKPRLKPMESSITGRKYV